MFEISLLQSPYQSFKDLALQIGHHLQDRKHISNLDILILLQDSNSAHLRYSSKSSQQENPIYSLTVATYLPSLTGITSKVGALELSAMRINRTGLEPPTLKGFSNFLATVSKSVPNGDNKEKIPIFLLFHRLQNPSNPFSILQIGNLKFATPSDSTAEEESL